MAAGRIEMAGAIASRSNSGCELEHEHQPWPASSESDCGTLSAPDPTSLPFSFVYVGANYKSAVLSIDREVKAIKEELLKYGGSSWFRENVHFTDCLYADTADFLDLLDRRPTVLHIGCHGQKDQLHMKDDPVSMAAIVHRISCLQQEPGVEGTKSTKDKFRLIVVNACTSYWLAESLAHVVDFVVGLTSEIKDSEAIQFSTVFYRELGKSSVYESFRKASCINKEGYRLLGLRVDPSRFYLVSPVSYARKQSRDLDAGMAGDADEAGRDPLPSTHNANAPLVGSPTTPTVIPMNLTRSGPEATAETAAEASFTEQFSPLPFVLVGSGVEVGDEYGGITYGWSDYGEGEPTTNVSGAWDGKNGCGETILHAKPSILHIEVPVDEQSGSMLFKDRIVSYATLGSLLHCVGDDGHRVRVVVLMIRDSAREERADPVSQHADCVVALHGEPSAQSRAFLLRLYEKLQEGRSLEDSWRRVALTSSGHNLMLLQSVPTLKFRRSPRDMHAMRLRLNHATLDDSDYSGGDTASAHETDSDEDLAEAVKSLAALFLHNPSGTLASCPDDMRQLFARLLPDEHGLVNLTWCCLILLVTANDPDRAGFDLGSSPEHWETWKEGLAEAAAQGHGCEAQVFDKFEVVATRCGSTSIPPGAQQCRKMHSRCICAIDFVVRESISKDWDLEPSDWDEKVLKDWFSTDEASGPFLMRANHYLTQQVFDLTLQPSSIGVRILEAVPMQSYGAFVVLGHLSLDLLFALLEVEHRICTRKHKSEEHDRPVGGFETVVASDRRVFSLRNGKLSRAPARSKLVVGLRCMAALRDQDLGQMWQVDYKELWQRDDEKAWDAADQQRSAAPISLKSAWSVCDEFGPEGRNVLVAYLQSSLRDTEKCKDYASGKHLDVRLQFVKLKAVKADSFWGQCEDGNEAVQQGLTCPILHSIMEDPVRVQDTETGSIEEHCYERAAIQREMESSGRSPLTRRRFTQGGWVLVPDQRKQAQIASFVESKQKEVHSHERRAEGEEERQTLLRRRGYGNISASHSHSETQVFDENDVLLACARGESLCVVGPPASGKTTMMMRIATFAAENALRDENALVPLFMRAAAKEILPTAWCTECGCVLDPDSSHPGACAMSMITNPQLTRGPGYCCSCLVSVSPEVPIEAACVSCKQSMNVRRSDRGGKATRVAETVDIVARYIQRAEHLAEVRSVLASLYVQGLLLVMIDGLDEAKSFRRSIERFLDLQLSPSVAPIQNQTLVVSTRNSSFAESRIWMRLKKFSPLEIQPLDESMAREMIKHRLEDEEREEALWADLQTVAARSPEHIYNVFLLSLVVETFRQHGSIPTRRQDLYTLSIQGTVDRCLAVTATAAAARCSRRFLECLAYVCHMELKTRDFVFDTSCKEQVRRRWIANLVDEGTWSEAEHVACTLLGEPLCGVLSCVAEPQGREGKTLRFCHLTQQEFLAACHLVREYGALTNEALRRGLTLDWLAEALLDPWNRQVYLFAASMLDDEGFQQFCLLLLKEETGTFAHCELVQAMLQERGPSEVVTGWLADKYAELRSTDDLILALSHPSTDLRERAITELQTFVIEPDYITALVCAGLIKMVEHTERCWFEKCAAILSLAQLCTVSQSAQTASDVVCLVVRSLHDAELHTVATRALGTLLQTATLEGNLPGGDRAILVLKQELMLGEPDKVNAITGALLNLRQTHRELVNAFADSQFRKPVFNETTMAYIDLISLAEESTPTDRDSARAFLQLARHQLQVQGRHFSIKRGRCMKVATRLLGKCCSYTSAPEIQLILAVTGAAGEIGDDPSNESVLCDVKIKLEIALDFVFHELVDTAEDEVQMGGCGSTSELLWIRLEELLSQMKSLQASGSRSDLSRVDESQDQDFTTSGNITRAELCEWDQALKKRCKEFEQLEFHDVPLHELGQSELTKQVADMVNLRFKDAAGELAVHSPPWAGFLVDVMALPRLGRFLFTPVLRYVEKTVEEDAEMADERLKALANALLATHDLSNRFQSIEVNMLRKELLVGRHNSAPALWRGRIVAREVDQPPAQQHASEEDDEGPDDWAASADPGPSTIRDARRVLTREEERAQGRIVKRRLADVNAMPDAEDGRLSTQRLRVEDEELADNALLALGPLGEHPVATLQDAKRWRQIKERQLAEKYPGLGGM